jgi:hypothetical protein
MWVRYEDKARSPTTPRRRPPASGRSLSSNRRDFVTTRRGTWPRSTGRARLDEPQGRPSAFRREGRHRALHPARRRWPHGPAEGRLVAGGEGALLGDSAPRVEQGRLVAEGVEGRPRPGSAASQARGLFRVRGRLMARSSRDARAGAGLRYTRISSRRSTSYGENLPLCCPGQGLLSGWRRDWRGDRRPSASWTIAVL